MTVGELVAVLSEFEDDLPVSNGGSYGGNITTVALVAEEDNEERYNEETGEILDPSVDIRWFVTIN